MSVVLAALLFDSHASAAEIQQATPASHGDPVAPILLAIVCILFAAILGGLLMKRIGQPAVLGELLVGMIIANVGYAFHAPVLSILREGPVVLNIINHAFTNAVSLQQAAQQVLPANASSARVTAILGSDMGEVAITIYQFIDQLSRIAVIFLLFLVGLETSLREMQKVGIRSFAVAVVGVISPWALGSLAVEWAEPGTSFAAHVFIGGILTATSVAISARVFRDLHVTRRREAQIVLGAAVIDDVLGLIILAVASGMVSRGGLHADMVAGTALRAIAFIVVALMAGLWFTPRALHRLQCYGISNLYILFGLGLAFVYAWIASRVGLATIIGAFVAGLVMEDFFKDKIEEGHSLREVLAPLEEVIVPIYFVLMGMQVKFEVFASSRTLKIAAGLILAAIIGKLAAGSAAGKRASWIAVGIAMVPRGEVGLIFASVGRTLGVVDDAVFSAVVAMIMVTTFIAPPLLKLTLKPEPQA